MEVGGGEDDEKFYNDPAASGCVTALAPIDAGSQGQADALVMRCRELRMQHNVELMG